MWTTCVARKEWCLRVSAVGLFREMIKQGYSVWFSVHLHLLARRTQGRQPHVPKSAPKCKSEELVTRPQLMPSTHNTFLGFGNVLRPTVYPAVQRNIMIYLSSILRDFRFEHFCGALENSIPVFQSLFRLGSCCSNFGFRRPSFVRMYKM